MRRMYWPWILSMWALTLVAHVGSTCAQEPSDYFAPRSPEKQQQLRQNESHHLYKGIRHLHAGAVGTINPVAVNQLQMAKGEFDFILNLWPNHPLVLGLMSDTLIKLRQPQLIESYFDKAYTWSPNAGAVYVAHGTSLLRRGDTAGGIARLKQGLELDPDSANGHYNLGVAYLQIKDYAQANTHAQRAYALGHPQPGLREQLQKVRAWKPLVSENQEGGSSAQAPDQQPSTATEAVGPGR